MASLTGNKIKDTYQSLLKTDDNGLITNVFKNITDGSGSASGLYLKNNGVLLSGSVVTTGSVDITGSLTLNGSSVARPYKVYTALLTQSGGDDPMNIDTGLLTIGVTYYINNNSLGMDFTNVGAPNNIAGASTYFVATGTTPNSWGAGQGTGNSTLTYNTGAPVVTVLENTIGNIWFTYSDIGVYRVNSDNLFIQDKTFVTVSPTVQNAGDSSNQTVQFVGGSESDTDILTIQTTAAANDGIPNRTPIEIRVYN
jgi:hypothetical protein